MKNEILLSQELSLKLCNFEDLEDFRKKDIEYVEEHPDELWMLGDRYYYSTSDNMYLVISIEDYKESLLPEIYGPKIYRTNEDSFDTTLYKILQKLCCYRGLCVGRNSYSSKDIASFIQGLNLILEHWENDIWKLYQLLLFIDDFLEPKYDHSLLKINKFFNIVELLIFNPSDSGGNQQKAKKKFPSFISGYWLSGWSVYLKEDYKPISELRNKERISEKIAFIRNKVTHNKFEIVVNELNEIFDTQSLTEDAESNGVFDQIRKFNMILHEIIMNIIESLVNDPNIIIELQQQRSKSHV